MIQRIQSLYMLVTAIIIGLMMFLPLADFLGGTEEVSLFSTGFIPAGASFPFDIIMSTYGLTAVMGVAALLPLVTIFLYKKRLVQYRLCIAEIVLLAGVIIFEIYYIWGGVRSVADFGVSAWTLNIAAFFPLIAIILMLLAIKGIKKDILMIKSLDRIR